ncbi:hypothetical protein [Nocardia callitridis]|uniref:Uncharacterized protein n=1 Tax=Nocardia callitridis TaxID=648753 RepID=A0ABP9K3M6_9NOCA
MGVIGELFPGQKAADESGQDSDGLPHRPRFELDLDKGVAVVPKSSNPPAEATGTDAGNSDGAD